MKKMNYWIFLVLTVVVIAQEAPVGSVVSPNGGEQKALDNLRGNLEGKIVWSSSRSSSRHDLWVMNADGSEKSQLTKGECVDWYPRFSPEGNRVLFTRSKSGWVRESDAEVYDKWDLWVVNLVDGDEKKVAGDGSWGTWRPTGDSVVFARGAKVFVKELEEGIESEIFNAEKVFKKGTYSQQPQLSSSGKLLAMTLRGTTRQTGIYNLEKKEWYSTGGGCQVEWFASDNKILRMNEGQGNGGTQVLMIDLDSSGKPIHKISGLSVPKKMRLMDLPGRRSHEYFPKVDKSGRYMVWCATRYGHEHDVSDYEVYLWDTGANKNDFVRLTFHSGNDRWPDIFMAEKR